MRACMAASAIAEPETPPMSVLRTTLTCASPPRICPVSTADRVMSLWVRPVSFMRFAAKMKSGIASSGKFCVCEIASWMVMVKGSCPVYCRKKKVPEMPIANATGIPIARKTMNMIVTSSILSILPTPAARADRLQYTSPSHLSGADPFPGSSRISRI